MKKRLITLAKFFASLITGLIVLTGVLAIWYQTWGREVESIEPGRLEMWKEIRDRFESYDTSTEFGNWLKNEKPYEK